MKVRERLIVDSVAVELVGRLIEMRLTVVKGMGYEVRKLYMTPEECEGLVDRLADALFGEQVIYEG